MKIYIDDFYNNKYNKKIEINIICIKNIIFELYSKNNINYLPIKLIYSIIFLFIHKTNFKIINDIIYTKILKKKYYIISKIIPNIIEYKWINLITNSIYNKVENEFIDYFLKLYELYIKEENYPKIYIIQARNILKKKIIYFRQLKKYFVQDIYYTLYYAPIIFSKISKEYININNIFIL